MCVCSSPPQLKCFYITDVLDAFEPTYVNVIAFNFSHKARESWERDSHDMRFKRLQHLLQKSNIYSKFLLTKMEQQQNEVWCKMWTVQAVCTCPLKANTSLLLY